MEFFYNYFREITIIVILLVGGYYLMMLDVENQLLKKHCEVMQKTFLEVCEKNERLTALNSHLQVRNHYAEKEQ